MSVTLTCTRPLIQGVLLLLSLDLFLGPLETIAELHAIPLVERDSLEMLFTDGVGVAASARLVLFHKLENMIDIGLCSTSLRLGYERVAAKKVEKKTVWLPTRHGWV